MEDETIVELLYRRDEGALEELEGKYGPGLLRLAGRFLKSREDVEEGVNGAKYLIRGSVLSFPVSFAS